MIASNEDLQTMFRNSTTEELEARLTQLENAISHLRSRGLSWAYDCREIRIAEHNSDHVFAELRRRKEADAETRVNK